MAVQYNSKDNSWGGFIVDIYKAKKGIVEVNDEATKFFDKTKNWKPSSLVITDEKKFDSFIKKMDLADESLISFLKDTEYSEKTLENYQLYLKNSANGLTLFQRAGKTAGSAIRTLGATLANMALVWVISEVISMIYSLVTASDRLQESAAKFGDEFASASSDIDNYKSKIAELHETIDSSTASYEETYSAREELLKIQDEMIEKFGSEAKSIDKVKDAINGVDEAFDSLTNDEWNKVKNDFNADTGESFGDKIAYLFSHDFGRSGNMDKMMEEMGSTKESFHIASASKTKEEQEKIDKFVEELRRLYNINIYRDPDGHGVYDKIEVAGDNLKDIYSKMLDIQKLGKSIGLDDSFLGNLSEKNGKIQNKIDQYDEMYNENIFQERVLKDENLAQKYKDITQAYKDSQEVIKNGGSDEDVKAAQEKVAKLIQETTDGLTDDSVITFFEEMYPDLQDVVGKWKFKVDFEANKDGFDDSIRDLISHFDSSDEIKKFNAQANPENVQYYDDLVAKATEYGLSVDQLIDKLEELGEIQSQRKIDLVDKLTSGKYSAEDKGQVNKFVNGLSEDDLKITQTEDFDKALEEQKKNLNGATLSLENYQAALEKAKEANPTINFKVDDLSKKIDEIQNAYKTLRDAIKEYNKEGYISVDTFQSIIGLGAEYLKYLVDENGNLRLDEQALKNVTIARIQDMVVAQKNSILDTAESYINFKISLSIRRFKSREFLKPY